MIITMYVNDYDSDIHLQCTVIHYMICHAYIILFALRLYALRPYAADICVFCDCQCIIVLHYYMSCLAILSHE